MRDKGVEIQEQKVGESLQTIWADSHLASMWTLKLSWVDFFSFSGLFIVYRTLELGQIS